MGAPARVMTCPALTNASSVAVARGVAVCPGVAVAVGTRLSAVPHPVLALSRDRPKAGHRASAVLRAMPSARAPRGAAFAAAEGEGPLPAGAEVGVVACVDVADGAGVVVPLWVGVGSSVAVSACAGGTSAGDAAMAGGAANVALSDAVGAAAFVARAPSFAGGWQAAGRMRIQASRTNLPGRV
jgi:hypothetical protein